LIRSKIGNFLKMEVCLRSYISDDQCYIITQCVSALQVTTDFWNAVHSLTTPSFIQKVHQFLIGLIRHLSHPIHGGSRYQSEGE